MSDTANIDRREALKLAALGAVAAVAARLPGKASEAPAPALEAPPPVPGVDMGAGPSYTVIELPSGMFDVSDPRMMDALTRALERSAGPVVAVRRR